jgi:hypothetical protein
MIGEELSGCLWLSRVNIRVCRLDLNPVRWIEHQSHGPSYQIYMYPLRLELTCYNTQTSFRPKLPRSALMVVGQKLFPGTGPSCGLPVNLNSWLNAGLPCSYATSGYLHSLSPHCPLIVPSLSPHCPLIVPSLSPHCKPTNSTLCIENECIDHTIAPTWCHIILNC